MTKNIFGEDINTDVLISTKTSKKEGLDDYKYSLSEASNYRYLERRKYSLLPDKSEEEYLLLSSPKGRMNGSSTKETVYSKILEVQPDFVVLNCLIDEGKRIFQKRVFERSPLEDIIELKPGNRIKIIIFSKPGEKKFVYNKWSDKDLEEIFKRKNYFEGFDDSSFFEPLPSE